MVPGSIAPLTQGGIDQMTPALARENRLMDLVQGPAPGYLGAKFGDGRSAVRARAQVDPFIGIGRQVVELVRICRRVHELVAAAANHHDRCDRALGEIFADYLPGSRTAFECRQQTTAIDRRGVRKWLTLTGEVYQRRQDLEVQRP